MTALKWIAMGLLLLILVPIFLLAWCIDWIRYKMYGEGEGEW